MNILCKECAPCICFFLHWAYSFCLRLLWKNEDKKNDLICNNLKQFEAVHICTASCFV